MAITQVQRGTMVATVSPATATLPGASADGTLLVAILRASNAPVTIGAPSGWERANTSDITTPGAVQAEIWHYVGNPGGLSSFVFTQTGGGTLRAQVTEYRGTYALAFDLTGSIAWTNTLNAQSASAQGSAAGGGELAVSNWSLSGSQQTGVTWTPGSGWVNDLTDFLSGDHHLSLGPGTISESVSWSNTAAAGVGIIATYVEVAAASQQGVVTYAYSSS